MLWAFEKIWSCNSQIMKIHKNHIYLTKHQKLTSSYWHLLKGELFFYMCVKIFRNDFVLSVWMHSLMLHWIQKPQIENEIPDISSLVTKLALNMKAEVKYLILPIKLPRLLQVQKSQGLEFITYPRVQQIGKNKFWCKHERGRK